MTYQKKAQVEVSFNWVFILIAGAVILFFFLRLITTEMDITETATQQRTVARMSSLLTAIQQNPDSISIRDQLNQEIQFECSAGNHEYGIPGSSARNSLPHQLIFTPEIIGNSRPIAWVRSFDTPFPVAPILYLTDPHTHYVFLKDGDSGYIVEKYYELLPDNMTKSLISASDIGSLSQDYRRYIIIAHENIEESSLNGIDNRIRNTNEYIIKLGNDEELTFQDTQRESQKIEGLSEDAIIGAIISGNKELFECTMTKILEQIRITTEINLMRVIKIHEAYPAGSSCKPLYSNILQNAFDDLVQVAQDENYLKIRTKEGIIRARNNNLLSAGCATIY